MRYENSNRHIRRFDKELILVQTELIKGRNKVVNEVGVLCDVRGVYSNEFYSAAQHNMKPERTFIVHDFEYSDETLLKFKDKYYKVIRVFFNDDNEVELTAESTRGPDN